MNQRQLALQILYQTINDESYSNLLMRKELNKLEPIQRGFVTNIVNGVLRKYEFLDFQIKDLINDNTNLKTKLILMMALFERFYLKEKDYVVNNEYVELGKNKYEKSFINALLHKIKTLKEPNTLSSKYNLPEWIVNLLSKQYDEDEFKRIIKVYQSIPSVYYRLNTNKAKIEDLYHLDINVVDENIFTSKNNLLNSDEYKQGLFYIQDYNSASLYKHLDLNKDSIFLDVCSAPGSKLFNALDIIKQENAYSNDMNTNRLELIKKMANKLGYDNIHYLNYDGRLLKDNLNIKFDRILLDAPCSGLGVISRKPDLKFHIKPESLDELEKLQYELLNSMDELLKSDGILLYSTCTLNKKENSKLIRKFLSNNEKYVLLEEDTIINELGDCFYYCKMRKN